MKGEKDNTITVLLSIFVVVLLAVSFAISIAQTSSQNTVLSKVTDESFNLETLGCYTADGEVNESSSTCALTVTYAPTGWRSQECPLTSVVVTNNTGTALTLDTDYQLSASTGVVTMLNTTDTNATNLVNVVKVDYTYCGDNYVSTSWARTILNTNTGLYALAILVAVLIVVVNMLGKEED